MTQEQLSLTLEIKTLKTKSRTRNQFTFYEDLFSLSMATQLLKLFRNVNTIW